MNDVILYFFKNRLCREKILEGYIKMLTLDVFAWISKTKNINKLKSSFIFFFMLCRFSTNNFTYYFAASKNVTIKGDFGKRHKSFARESEIINLDGRGSISIALKKKLITSSEVSSVTSGG